jgi:hypothetical protein
MKNNVLTNYKCFFKSDLIFFNNLLEVSKHIVFKKEDLIKLISILTTKSDISKIKIEYEFPDHFKACSCCS